MPAKVVVQNVYSRIYGDIPLAIEEEINKTLQYRIQNYEHIIEAQAKRGYTTDGIVHLYWPRKGHMFYTGMMSDVLRILDKANFEYEITDRRFVPDRNLIDMKFIPPAWKTERDYQNIIAASMIKAGRGVMQAATGAGKTFITSKMIGSIKSGPFLFFVPSKDLLDQSYDCLSECIDIPIGRIGDGHFDVQQINVATIQTAVKAVNSNNPRFKIADYKFDDEDDWDEDQLDDSNSKIMDSLIRSASGIYMDEVHHAASKSCQAIMEAASNAYWRYGGSVGPESYIELKGGCFENGFVGTIENAFEIASKESNVYSWKEFQVVDLVGVFSRGWSGSGFVWKNCLRILRHSGKQCLRVNAKGTNLLVTPDHSVYKAESGNKVWITTGKKRKRKTLKFEPKMDGTSSVLLSKGDVLFGDDGANFGDEKEPQINMVEFCSKHMIGSKVTVCCDVKSLDHNLLHKIANPKTIYNWKRRGGIPIESFIKIKNPPPIFFLTGNRRTIRIAPQINLANWAYMLGFYLGDGWVENNSKKIGFTVELDRAKFISAKMKSLEGVTWKVKKRIMPGKSVELKANNIFVAKLLLSIFGNVRCYSKSIPGEWILSWTREHREQLLQGLLDSDGTVCNGQGEKVSYSINTTSEHFAKSICSLLRSLGLWGGTTIKKRSGGIVKGRQIIAKHDSYVTKWSKKRPDVKKSGIFEHFDHRSIKFAELSVRKVSKDITPEWIYDLEMSGHPSFTADGILVHNSATPFREDGAEKMIQALFGKVVTNVSASWLIRHNYLVKPYIFNIEMSGMHGLFNSYPKVYENYIVKNDELNQLVAKLAIRMRQLNIPTLILVQRYNHGEIIKKYLPDAPFIKGNMPRKKRKDSIASLRDGTLNCAIATTLADEGLDVERLGCVTVAGGGKSITRVYQRVGRALRTFPGKDKAIIFLFSHEATFLKSHGEKVARILKREPEFVIINTNETRVMDDLNQLLCPSSTGIFD
jgi:superfamily II DNA or RNA helicase/intein/homing endonuclease